MHRVSDVLQLVESWKSFDFALLDPLDFKSAINREFLDGIWSSKRQALHTGYYPGDRHFSVSSRRWREEH